MLHTDARFSGKCRYIIIILPGIQSASKPIGEKTCCFPTLFLSSGARNAKGKNCTLLFLFLLAYLWESEFFARLTSTVHITALAITHTYYLTLSSFVCRIMRNLRFQSLQFPAPPSKKMSDPLGKNFFPTGNQRKNGLILFVSRVSCHSEATTAASFEFNVCVTKKNRFSNIPPSFGVNPPLTPKTHDLKTWKKSSFSPPFRYNLMRSERCKCVEGVKKKEEDIIIVMK